MINVNLICPMGVKGRWRVGTVLATQLPVLPRKGDKVAIYPRYVFKQKGQLYELATYRHAVDAATFIPGDTWVQVELENYDVDKSIGGSSTFGSAAERMAAEGWKLVWATCIDDNHKDNMYAAARPFVEAGCVADDLEEEKPEFINKVRELIEETKND